MRQLAGLDATFLYLETAETPMHVAGLTLYDLPEHHRGRFHETFRAFFASRLHLVPVFGKKLARTVLELDHPGWVDAGEPDLAYHIKGVTLPAPGTREQLEAWVASEHARPLDRSKPLWQFTVIEGLQDGQGALYSKVHHAAIDGGAGMAITKALYDLTETPRQETPPEPVAQGRKPTVPERAVLGLHDLTTNLVRQQLRIMEAVPTVMGRVIETLAGAVDAGSGSGGSGGPSRSGGGGLALPGDLIAPHTPFNTSVGRERTYAARTLALRRVKALAKASGAKVNDVVMAVCAGALRAYLSNMGALPAQPLIAFVPVSLREAGDTTQNNQVSGMNVPLATHLADPLERLARIVEDSTQRKLLMNAARDLAPTDFTLLGAPLILPGLMQLYGSSNLAEILPQAVNLCISNTMGPPVALYCDGAKVTHLYPVSIATHGVGLNITVQSYLDNLDFGITAGRKALPNAGRLADLLDTALGELESAVAARSQGGTKAADGTASAPGGGRSD